MSRQSEPVHAALFVGFGPLHLADHLHSDFNFTELFAGFGPQHPTDPARHPPTDHQAQFELGRRYLIGEGVPQSDAEAAKWYRLAADQGDAWAQSGLGFMYDKGRGVPQSDAEAVKWFRLAAKNKDESFKQSALESLHQLGFR